MKKILIGCIIGFCLSAVVAFTVANYEPKKSSAEVEQYQGLYVFSDSKPVKEYDYLGTVKRNTGGFGGGQYTDVRDGLIKRAKSDYPAANGIILILKAGAADRADAIRIKE